MQASSREGDGRGLGNFVFTPDIEFTRLNRIWGYSIILSSSFVSWEYESCISDWFCIDLGIKFSWCKFPIPNYVGLASNSSVICSIFEQIWFELETIVFLMLVLYSTASDWLEDQNWAAAIIHRFVYRYHPSLSFTGIINSSNWLSRTAPQSFDNALFCFTLKCFVLKCTVE